MNILCHQLIQSFYTVYITKKITNPKKGRKKKKKKKMNPIIAIWSTHLIRIFIYNFEKLNNLHNPPDTKEIMNVYSILSRIHNRIVPLWWTRRRYRSPFRQEVEPLPFVPETGLVKLHVHRIHGCAGPSRLARTNKNNNDEKEKIYLFAWYMQTLRRRRRRSHRNCLFWVGN